MENYELKYRDALVRECWMWAVAITVLSQTLNVITDSMTKGIAGYAVALLIITAIAFTLTFVRVPKALMEISQINKRHQLGDDHDHAGP